MTDLIQKDLVLFPNSKINLGLRVINKRKDGFHDIQTLFVPIPIKDVMEISPSEDDNTHLTVSGDKYSLPDNDINNDLCIKAYNLLKEEFDIKPVNIHLHKNIPSGAGLGGGSSDAAFVLKAINKLCGLHLNSKTLAKYASKIGSDCGSFIYEHPMYAEERGDLLFPISTQFYDFFPDLTKPRMQEEKTEEIIFTKQGSEKAKALQLHKDTFLSQDGRFKWKIITLPQIHVSTAEAYYNVCPDDSGDSLYSRLSEPIETWKDTVFNDFEKTVFKKHPEIKFVKDMLYEQGAIYASMSGSGSSVFGIFRLKK